MNYLSVSEFEALKKTYILRARVISGSIPLPNTSYAIHSDLNATNFEIIAPYTKENFKKLLKISDDACKNDSSTCLEILAWAGGADNHDGDRFLWSYQTGARSSAVEEEYLFSVFDISRPTSWLPGPKRYYNEIWRKLKRGFSLAAYEHYALNSSQNELDALIKAADTQITKNDFSRDKAILEL